MKILLLLSTIIFLFSSTNSNSATCRVKEVHDGDTIELECSNNAGTFNIYGIDCPEFGQKYGEEAYNTVSEIIKDSIVEATIYLYEREADIILDGKSLSSYLVLNGYAFSKNRKNSTNNYLLNLEKKAKENRTNIWSDAIIEKPWDFRKRNNILDDKDMAYKILADASGDNSSQSSRYSLDQCDRLVGGDAFLCKKNVYKERRDAKESFRESCKNFFGKSGNQWQDCIDRNVAAQIDWDLENPYRTEKSALDK